MSFDGRSAHLLERALRNQWPTILAFAAAALVAALAASLAATPLYEAVALIQLMPRAGQELDLNAVVKQEGGYLETRDRARTQMQIILSRTLRDEVLARYALLGQSDPAATPAGSRELLESMSVGPREDTQLVEIRVLHKDPESAALLANLVAEVYREDALDARTGAARDSQDWLDSKAGDYREALDLASEQLMVFKEANDLVDVEDAVDAVTSRMDALEKALGEVTTERAQLEGILEEHQRLLNTGQAETLAGMLDDPGLTAISRERAKVVTDAALVLARYGEQHPEHQQAVREVERVDALITDEVTRIVGQERSELRGLRLQEDRINEELSSVKQELLAKQRLQEEYASLKLDEERARKVYASLADRGAEVELEASSGLHDVRIIDLATVPGRPSSPRIALNLVVALGLGLGGGLGLALLREQLNRRILHPSEVEHYLKTPMVGALPTVPDGHVVSERALAVWDRPRSARAEAFRSLRAVLMMTPGHDGSRVFVVTSSVPGEGKTHASVGLAVAFAQLGHTTVLVDADLRRPSVHQIFKLADAPGVGEAAAEGFKADHLQATRIPSLFLLSAGGPVENPTELLCSPELPVLMRRLRSDFQVVIVDTAPAGLTSDAAELARHSDGLVMVVRRNLAERSEVQTTLEQLRRVDTHILGVVLNDVPMPRSATAYGGYYSDDKRRPSLPTEAPSTEEVMPP